METMEMDSFSLQVFSYKKSLPTARTAQLGAGDGLLVFTF